MRKSLDVNPLFRRIELIDSWADVIPNLGPKANDILAMFLVKIKESGFPNIEMKADMPVSDNRLLTGREVREYVVVHEKSSNSYAIMNITAYGEHLYVSWDMFVYPRIRWFFLLGLLLLPWLLSGVLFDPYARISFPLLLLAGFALVLLAFWLFESLPYKELYFTKQHDVTACSMVIHSCLMETLDTIGYEEHILRQKRIFKGGSKVRVI